MRLALVVRDDTQFLLLKDLTLIERNLDSTYLDIYTSFFTSYDAQRIHNINPSIVYVFDTGHFRGDFLCGF